jgi:SRSO17 transposase
MPHPIVCQDEHLHQYLQSFSALFSRPQYEHFVTVLMGLLVGKEGYTLSHLKDAIAGAGSLSSLSRFLGEAPWDHQLVAKYNFSLFCRKMQPKIEEERRKRRDLQPKKRGKRVTPLVTGYLIGDDSTMSKPKGRKMQGIGKHYSTTAKKPINGHSLVQCLYTVLDRSCPLEPLVYRQEEVAKKENVPFTSKIDLMIQQIQNFTPLPGTRTHVLLDSWYNAKKVWKAARDLGYLITTGTKCNRFLRVSCDTQESGWKWQKLSDYAASLPESAYQRYNQPRNPKKKVYVHVVDTSIRKLYRCKLIIVRQNLDDPLSEARYWVSSDLAADAETLLKHISTRWEIEVFFGDAKGLLGIDQYQLMTTTALLRYWTLCWIAFSFLEEIRHELKEQKHQIEKEGQEECEQQPATLGQAREEVQKRHFKLFLEWVYQQAFSGMPIEDLFAFLVA